MQTFSMVYNNIFSLSLCIIAAIAAFFICIFSPIVLKLQNQLLHEFHCNGGKNSVSCGFSRCAAGETVSQ